MAKHNLAAVLMQNYPHATAIRLLRRLTSSCRGERDQVLTLYPMAWQAAAVAAPITPAATSCSRVKRRTKTQARHAWHCIHGVLQRGSATIKLLLMMQFGLAHACAEAMLTRPQDAHPHVAVVQVGAPLNGLGPVPAAGEHQQQQD
jgi:hypothetical protein